MENENSAAKQKRLGCFPYVLGGLSFIPLVGVSFGIVVIIWGLIKLKQGGWKLILLGACGILFTVVLYGTLFYKGFVERGGIYDTLRSQMAQPMLTDLVKEIEQYKIQNGKYPESLEELIPEKEPQSSIMIYDPAYVDLKMKEPRLFYYELINEGKNYYLLSSGVDGTAFTEDDMHPIVSEEEMKNIGYRKKNQLTKRSSGLYSAASPLRKVADLFVRLVRMI